MAISSSSGSNTIGHSPSPPSFPSSSDLSATSLDSIPESREPTPEYNPTAAHEALAPLHWDAEEFDFGIASEDDEPQTEGEDLLLMFQEELESSSEEKFSWDGADSSSKEEIGSPSSDDEPMGGKPFRFLMSSEEDSEEESGGGGGWSDNNNDSNGGDAPARSPKRRRY